VRVLANGIAEPDRSRWRLEEAKDELAARLPALIEALADA
jgi:hypothetical protein